MSAVAKIVGVSLASSNSGILTPRRAHSVPFGIKGDRALAQGIFLLNLHPIIHDKNRPRLQAASLTLIYELFNLTFETISLA